VLRRNVVTGAPGATPQPALGAIDLSATDVEVVDNTVTNMRWAGIMIRGGIARVDSNLVSRNVLGVRVGAAAAATTGMRGNSLFDNDTLPATVRRTARGVVNEGVAMTTADNWWGDPRGPRRDVPPATTTFGDSASGLGTFPAAATPIGTHVGGGTMGTLRKVGGDGQTGAVAATFAEAMAVRIVDAQGRPLAGTSVSWKVSRTQGDFVGGIRSGSDNIITVTSDASGLAQVQFIGGAAGTATVTATAGSQTVTFTATVQ
jgi:hypothetical protein